MIYRSVRENLRELFSELGVRKNFANLSLKPGIMKVDSYYILEKNARNFSQHFAFSIHILTMVLWCRHCYYSHFQRWTFLSKISQEHTPIKGYMLGCEFSPCGSLPITGKLHYHLRVLYIPSIFNQSILPQRVEGEHSQEDKRYSITIVSL